MRFLLLPLLLLPSFAFAQGLQGYIGSVITFISGVLIPFLLGIAFLTFSINAIRFFVVEGNNEEGRENAKALALYSVMAVVAILIFWGVISLFARGTGLSGKNIVTPDYLEKSGVQLKNSFQNQTVNCILTGGGGIQVTASECASYGGVPNNIP